MARWLLVWLFAPAAYGAEGTTPAASVPPPPASVPAASPPQAPASTPVVPSPQAPASTPAGPLPPVSPVLAPPEAVGSDAFRVARAPDRPRSQVLAPLLSFLIPGLDQWWEGQYVAAGAYTGAYVASGIYAGYQLSQVHNDPKIAQERAQNEGASPFVKDPVLRRYNLGLQMMQVSQGMSAYHAFRTAVVTHQRHGRYRFLQRHESTADIFLAPFQFRYLKRTSTLIPLGIAAVLSLASATASDESLRESGLERDAFTGEDAFFAGAISFNAGTHEEALFRGWLLPYFHEQWGSPLWANIASAGLFAAAHLGNNSFPLAQALLGYHLGNVTMDDGWTLGEAVFIHTWWDVIVLISVFHQREIGGRRAQLPREVLVPLLRGAF